MLGTIIELLLKQSEISIEIVFDNDKILEINGGELYIWEKNNFGKYTYFKNIWQALDHIGNNYKIVKCGVFDKMGERI